MSKLQTGILFFVVLAFTITTWSFAVLLFAKDSENAVSIISGVLSMIGGMIGALSAYLIARMQLTKQLELQDKTDRKRIYAEMKLHKAEEILSDLNKNLVLFNELKNVFNGFIDDVIKQAKKDKVLDFSAFEKIIILDKLVTLNAAFFGQISSLKRYKPMFKEIIIEFEEYEQEFRSASVGVNTLIQMLDEEFYKQLYPGYFLFDKELKDLPLSHSFINIFEKNAILTDHSLARSFIYINRQIEIIEKEVVDILNDFISSE